MTKINLLRLLIAAITLNIVAASHAQAPIAVRWDMGHNEAQKGWYSSKFVIKNVSGKVLGANWQFYFNQFTRPVTTPQDCPVDVDLLSTTYYRVTPNARYRSLAPGDSLVVDMLMRGTYVNVCYSPMGGHVVLDGDMAHPVAVHIAYGELRNPGQWIARNDYPDGNRVYAFNETLKTSNDKFNCWDIFPSIKHVKFLKGTCDLGGGVTVVAASSRVADEKHFLLGELKARGVKTGRGVTIKIGYLGAGTQGNPERYTITVGSKEVKVLGASRDGLLNGLKTLVAAIDHSSDLRLLNAAIDDEPAMHYRGLMLDISRNFTTYGNLLRFIDILSYYKLNVLQLHFADDEAWRLEIPGLPELTSIASRRGCTINEDKFLAQIFDGNGNPDDLTQSANGYITRSQMVDLLKYAHARGVRVVPEVETPGHARAAIVAMKARYNKYKDTDMAEALRYKLWDEADSSDFVSAQDYNDNVLNVAQDGVYNFITKVAAELQSMYRDAGLTLDMIHLGGDEVASGAWDKSPAIARLMQAQGLATAHQVHEYFIERAARLLQPMGLKIGGWQEVGLDHSDDYNARMAPRFGYVNAWSTVGRRADIPYKLANAGYPTVLSNVTNFYIDMAYNWHQYEKGLHWGGAVDEYASWSAQPLDVYRTARSDYDGNPIDLKHAAQGKVALRPEKAGNIIGIIGPLWAETIRDFDQVQSYVLPKALGLVQRAWNPQPEWNDDDESTYVAARARYNAQIGLCELPVLAKQGRNFHLGQPGITVDGGMLHANCQYPGETVRYTLDGSDPTASSPVWTAPVPVGNATLVKAKSFYLGKESVCTYLWVK